MADLHNTSLRSDMHGAPLLNATAGSLLAVLDATLINGFGAVTPSAAVVADGVMTFTTNAGESFAPGDVVVVSGASVAAINGAYRVAAGAGQTSFMVPAPGVDDGVVAGALSVRYAPVGGWIKKFAASGIAVYASALPESRGCCLRVDDTGTTSARVVAYETMSDIDTGSGPFPTAAQQPGGLYWPKANNTTGSRDWEIAADARTLYYYVRADSASANGVLLGFGDLDAADAADAYTTFIAGLPSASYGSSSAGLAALSATPTNYLYVPRMADALSGAAQARLTSALRSGGVSGDTGASSQFAQYPNTPGAALLCTPVLLCDAGGVRGTLPGLYHTPQAMTRLLSANDRGAVGDLRVLCVNSGAAFVDALNAWARSDA